MTGRMHAFVRSVRFRQQGMAVIGALVVVAVASVTAAAIVERQSLLAETLAGERDRAQARWLLRGGLDWARIILHSDARNNPVTLNNAIWAQPIAGLEISAPGQTRKAHFSGQIEDEQGKYNLWRLAVHGTVQPVELAILERLIAVLGMPASLAAAVAQRVAESQAGPSPQQAPGLRVTGDLLGIEGMTLDMAATLSGYLTILPQKTAINVNTASAEVLSASVPGLDLPRARGLTEQRDRGLWFNSRADFINRLGDAEMVPASQVAVNSDWFKVTGEVTLDHAAVGMQALLHRQGDRTPLIQWIED